MKAMGLEEGRVFGYRMRMDVPRCPACGCEDTAVREKVIRGRTEITFWCCPQCRFSWRMRSPGRASGSVHK